MPLFGLLHFLSFKKCRLWLIIVVFLYIPLLAYSQPPDHFVPSALSGIQKGEFLLAQSRNDEALRLYESLINEGKGGGYAFRGLVRAYKNTAMIIHSCRFLKLKRQRKTNNDMAGIKKIIKN